MNYKETIKRTIVKTIVFKIFTTSITALFTGIGEAIVIHLILTAFYLVHERVWNNINWQKRLQ